MTTDPFAIVVAVVAGAIALAVLAQLLSRRVRIPAPAFFLIAAALGALLLPPVSAHGRLLDERVVSVALAVILFDGGMHIGWRRFRASAWPIVWLGILGTALTAAAVAASAHFIFGLDATASLLLGAALSPTDPAVVFSVLGKTEIGGRSGTILEGESGANDPVGIAIMASLLAASGTGWAAVGSGVLDFVLQLVIGAAVGVVGGLGLRWVLRRLALPNEALASVFAVAAAVFLYGAGAVAHGSGFLAVFVAGIAVGDLRAPYKREITLFSSGLASLAEVVAFAVLGLTVELDYVLRPSVLWTGLGIAALLIFLIRPLFVGLVALPIRLAWGERGFVLWAGLKGAVPILLGLLVVSSGIAGAHELYAIVFVVVLVSVVLQGGLVPVLGRVFRVPMRATPAGAPDASDGADPTAE
ncbi:cation:proton antiporter [Gryllotalpicola protaetiae]|uniref:cation:proton antiporter domain-containing protein n=1 Tax=Gryllotalpicola protaetiae TaxID=2419771 RepID=UPI0013C43991|nr:cation:proton antiporter [Gryllotalpicola protaetiae]